MNDKIMTVQELKNFLNNLKGIDDFQIKIGDEFLYVDEISINPMDKQLNITGRIYHEDLAKRSIELKEDIKEAVEKFWRID